MAISDATLAKCSKPQLQRYLDAFSKRLRYLDAEIGVLMTKRADTEDEIASVTRALLASDGVA